jgi:arylsulfatase A-like enzyme
MLHHKAPHREWDPDLKNKALFADREFPEPLTLWDDYKTRPAALPENEQTIANDLTRRDLKLNPPEELQGQERNKWLGVKPTSVTVDGQNLEGKALVQWKYQRYMQDYLACVQGVDDSVGTMLDYLDEKGLAENTLVIYTADNGWYLGEFGMYDKRFMYEPGLRSPLIMRGPGIQPGSTPDAMVANIDLAPTFLGFANLPIPEFMQGRSLVGLLQGQVPSDWRKSVYYRYYHDPGHHNTRAHYGVRTATHKLIYYWRKDAYELFDLTEDPLEQNNLMFQTDASQKEETTKLFAEMKQELDRLQQFYNDDGKYADPKTWPAGGSDGPFDEKTPLGRVSIPQAIGASKGG